MDRIGPYDIEAELGRGGAGVVYRGVHPTDGPVAIKVLRRRETRDRASLQREIDVLSALSHPGIVRILDQGESDGQRWIATELLDGVTLRQALGATPSPNLETFDFDRDPEAVLDVAVGEAQPPKPEVLLALGQLVHALSWLHGEGVVHRDVKPENVMLVDGRAVLLDFGMATLSHARDAPERLPGGTLGYMAPEQARGEAVDARADLYALGCMIAEALTGRLPTHPLEPLPRLDALVRPLLALRPEERVLQRDALTAALGVPSFGPPPRTVLHRPPLVGRADAMAAIEARVAARRGSLLVTGPSGVGRTRVAMELFGRVRQRGWSAFVGHGGGPLEAFVPLVKGACARVGPGWEASDPERASLAAVAGFLGVPVDLPMPAPLEPEPSRLRLLEGLVVALTVVGARRSVAVLVDELHEADRFTVEAVCWLGRVIAAGDVGCVLLATWDTDASAPPPMLADTLGEVIVLGPLSAEELGRLARGASPQARPVNREVAVRLAEGLPLLCVEGLRIQRGGTFAETFGERALARLSALSSPARALVEVAAVGGASVDLAALGDAVGLHGRALSMAQHEARRDGFVEMEDGWVRIPHRQLQQAVSEALEPSRLRALHRALAERSSGERRADHLEKAGCDDAAREAWVEVVRTEVEPLRRQRALERLVPLWTGNRPPWLELELAQAAQVRGDRARAIAHARQVPASDPSLRCRALLILAQGLPRGDEDVAASLLEARELSDAHGLRDLSIEVRLITQQIARRLGQPLESILAGLEEVRGLIGPDQPVARVRLAHEHGTVLFVFGRNHEAARVLGEAQAFLDAADVRARCALLGNLGAARWQAHDLDGAIQATMANLRTASRHGVLGSLRVAMANLSILMSGMGDDEAFEGLLGGALSIRIDDDEGLLGIVLRAVDALLSRADVPRALPLLEMLLHRAQREGSKLYEYEVRFGLARCHLLDGRWDRAAAILQGTPEGLRNDPRELLDLVRVLYGEDAPMPTSTEACLVLGLTSDAPAHRAHARAVFEETFRKVPLAVHRRWAERFGAVGLPPAASAPLLPPEIDALCRPLGPALERALTRLA